MKIVILDGYTENPGDLSWAGFEALGEVTVYDRTPADQIVPRIGDAQVVYTNKTPITRQTLDACPGVKFIGVLATGYNVVDVVAAKEKGIPVSNIPTYGTAAVGQFAIALLLEICHHIGHHSKAVHDGRWQASPDFCFWDYPLIELDGKTMGIIGYGRIGQSTGRIAQALGMKVLAFDAYHDPALESDTMRYVALDELLDFLRVLKAEGFFRPEEPMVLSMEVLPRPGMDGDVVLANTKRALNRAWALLED